MAAPNAATPFNNDLPNYKNMPKLLTGQKALVTGANSGIGQACAIGLARAGADVVVNYVAGGTDEVIKAIEAEGRKGIAIKADVSNEAEVDAMFKQAIGECGTLDILVANAGLQRDSAFVNMTMAQRVYELNSKVAQAADQSQNSKYIVLLSALHILR